MRTPEGIPGFDESREWALERSHPEAVFCLLRPQDAPDRGILVAEPWQLAPGYEPDLPEAELERISITGPEDVELYVVVTLTPERTTVFLNLAAPIVVHRTERLARQVILDRQGWPLRHAVEARG
ncbi:MAG: flagellar assembly protein FliW [Ilumatobacteraceae bacterium]